LTGTGISHSTPPVLTTIPIAIIPIIDAGTASLSLFRRNPKMSTITLESSSRSAGIRVHDPLESVVTISRNMQSASPPPINAGLRHSPLPRLNTLEYRRKAKKRCSYIRVSPKGKSNPGNAIVAPAPWEAPAP
jgi:hypothetical protein